MTEGYLISSSVEVMCFIVVFILLIGNTFETGVSSKRKKYFNVCLIVCLISILADFFTLTLNGNKEYTTFLWIPYIITFVFGEVMITCFTYYTFEYLNQKSITIVGSFTYANIISIVNTLGILFTVILLILGKIIVVKDGYFVPGEYNGLIGLSAMVTIIASIIYTIIQSKKIGIHDTIAISLFYLIPFAARIIEAKNPQISIAISSTSISMLTVYIMLQSKEFKESQLREQLQNHYSHTDALTGMQNRRSFNESLSNIKQQNNIGIIYSDINGLKNVNDTLGHLVGDEFIKNYSNLLLKIFEYKQVFRISGDEFVIVVDNLSEPEFTKKAEKLRENIKQCEDVAAIGYAYGSAERTPILIENAEGLMYEDKKQYHLKHGNTR